MTDEQWLCQCDEEEHGPQGCLLSAADDEGLCTLCQDDIHDAD